MAAQTRSTMADFIITQSLGKGSYGSVYKVKRKQDSQFYAIKEVNIKKLQPKEREDAVNEIRIMASIKHKNIVRYCDAFLERDNLYIAMEFAEHGDISRQIDKFKAANKYIKEDTIWSYFIQMMHGLALMHSRNVLHRDLKPKNVFLTGKNHLRLGDLGCAKLMKSGMARTQIGTPYYMSPEIWLNKPYDARSDVWALGCLVYELAMLSPPFLANDMNGLALKVKTTPAPRISKHYSEDLGNLVASMLSKDPKARPDVRAILAMPAVQAKMHTLPPEEEGCAWAGEEMRIHLINTIRVPAGFGMGFGGLVRPGGPPQAGLILPAPDFPVQQQQQQPSSAPVAQPAAAAAIPAAAAVVARAPLAAAPFAGNAAAAAAAAAPPPKAAAPYVAGVPASRPPSANAAAQPAAAAAAPRLPSVAGYPAVPSRMPPTAAAAAVPSAYAPLARGGGAGAVPTSVAAAAAAASAAAAAAAAAAAVYARPSAAAAYIPRPIASYAGVQPSAYGGALAAHKAVPSAAYMYGLAAAARPIAARPIIVGGRPY